ncbi:MAG TPA: hypothetical protein VNW73_12130 [Ktedonobacteraceae bacterium]|nr:hypothetical protein [Ktedonobacteraceae bacterium]
MFMLFLISGICLIALLAVLVPLLGLKIAPASAADSLANTQTIQMPPTQTSCPANGTARAAVMRPVKLGKDPTIVYVYNEVPLNTTIAYGHLKFYDVTTGQKSVLVTSGLSIENAQVSANGQWVLFLSQIDPRGDRQHESMLQLIRIDGQGLQTLYCLPAGIVSRSTNIQWSTDQKSILISTDDNTSTSTVTLLNIATGKLTTELKITDKNYEYSVLTWLDHTRAYVVRSGRFGPVPPIVLSILDTAKYNNPNGRNLKKVLEHSIRFSYLSLDISYDAKQLFVGYCWMVGANQPFDTTISVGPATGGTQKTIYHQAPTICVQELRAVAPQTLLMTVQSINLSTNTSYNQLWKMKPDGSSRTVLFNHPTNATTYHMNVFTQFPWSNVSRGGSMYTLQTTNQKNLLQTLVYGSLKGGNPIQFAYTSRGSVDIVGWTTWG